MCHITTSLKPNLTWPYLELMLIEIDLNIYPKNHTAPLVFTRILLWTLAKAPPLRPVHRATLISVKQLQRQSEWAGHSLSFYLWKSPAYLLGQPQSYTLRLKYWNSYSAYAIYIMYQMFYFFHPYEFFIMPRMLLCHFHYYQTRYYRADEPC